jgi:hypothetical protein
MLHLEQEEMANNKNGITEIVTLTTRIKHESQFWQGYDPTLVDKLVNTVDKLEDNISYDQKRLQILGTNWFKYLIGCAVITGVIFLFITLWVAMGTSWRDAKKAVTNEVRKELQADEKTYRSDLKKEYQTDLENYNFEKFGFKKDTVFGKTIWYKE